VNYRPVECIRCHLINTSSPQRSGEGKPPEHVDIEDWQEQEPAAPEPPGEKGVKHD
jgi:hypothetical protein